MDNSIEKLEKTDELLRKYQQVLHPQHFIQISLQQSLIEMYGRIKGYTLPELPNIMLDHKIMMCRNVLHILDRLHPGKTRIRALLMYELHAPIVITAKSAFLAGLINGQQLKEKMLEAKCLLNNCIEILVWEDVASVEANIAKISKYALKEVTQSIAAVQ